MSLSTLALLGALAGSPTVSAAPTPAPAGTPTPTPQPAAPEPAAPPPSAAPQPGPDRAPVALPPAPPSPSPAVTPSAPAKSPSDPTPAAPAPGADPVPSAPAPGADPVPSAPAPATATAPAPTPSPSVAPPPSAAPAAAAPKATPAVTGERTVTTSADELVTVRTELTPDPSNVGDLLTLEVIAAYAAGVTVNLPMGLDFSPLHVVAVDESEPESTGEGFRKRFTITLQRFRPGEAAVPSFPLTYLDTEGNVQTVTVAPTRFVVDSLLANENEPKREGEDSPYSLEYPNERAELIIYSSLVALFVGFLLTLLIMRWRRRPRPELLPPPVPAHETALKALQELEEQSLVEEQRYADYYLELTEIAKTYIEGRFGIEALDRTTEEIRLALMRSGARIEPLDPDDVIRFLSHADLVKFARFEPEQDEARAAIGQVREMVETTIPKPGEPARAAAEGDEAPEDGDDDDADELDDDAPKQQPAAAPNKPAEVVGDGGDDEDKDEDKKEVGDASASKSATKEVNA